MTNTYDLIIIGGGPAGLSASIYACRAGYNTLLIEKIGFGGQMMLTDIIENYPGFPQGITGFQLQENMLEQAKKFGMKSINANVTKIQNINNNFIINTNEETYTALSVIIASGANHKELNITGEREFAGRGVSYCATCDGPFFKNKNVFVIGGGDSAITEALFLAKFASKVNIAHRRDRFRAVKDLVEKAKTTNNISFMLNSILLEINGDSKVKSIKFKDIITNEVKEIETDGVFIFIGIKPNTEFVEKNILDKDGYINIDINMETNIKGLFAAGDVCSNTFRQVICASSDGAKAAEHAGKYIDELKGVAY